MKITCDNITIETEAPIDPEVLLAWAKALNQCLEDNREEAAAAQLNFSCFGTCIVPGQERGEREQNKSEIKSKLEQGNQ